MQSHTAPSSVQTYKYDITTSSSHRLSLHSSLNIAQPASPIFLKLFRSLNCYGSFSRFGLDTKTYLTP